MIFRIPKGKHGFWPFKFGLWWDRNVFTWRVMFHFSCRYNLQSTDQLDTNKLIGIGYLWHHHKDSARFGWRYDKAKDCIEIMAYCYVTGKRIIKHIAFVPVGEWVRLELYVTGHAYFYSVANSNTEWDKLLGEGVINHGHKKRLQYGLWPYFGGNRPTPHDIKIQIEKL